MECCGHTSWQCCGNRSTCLPLSSKSPSFSTTLRKLLRISSVFGYRTVYCLCKITPTFIAPVQLFFVDYFFNVKNVMYILKINSFTKSSSLVDRGCFINKKFKFYRNVFKSVNSQSISVVKQLLFKSYCLYLMFESAVTQSKLSLGLWRWQYNLSKALIRLI